MKATPVTLRFNAQLITVNDWVIVRLPEDVSEKLSSRGQVAVQATVNDHALTLVLEPDGYWGHWFRMSDELQEITGLHTGDTASVSVTQIKTWPEPTLPPDIATAIKSASTKVKDKWHDITPMARWEWVRWVNSTAVDETRTVRIEKTISKLEGKHRRPCCFNLAACTEPAVAKSGRLAVGDNAHR